VFTEASKTKTHLAEDDGADARGVTKIASAV
jgi:hypothetical protein